MAIDSYGGLQTAILNWIARPGDTNLSANAPDFIAMAEQMFAYGSDDPDLPFDPLRIRPMETPVDLVIGSPLGGNTVGGSASAITLTPQTPVSANVNGALYQFTPPWNCTGAATFQNSTAPAAPLVKGSARSPLAANDFILGGTYNVYFDGINQVWVLLPALSQCPLPANYLSMRGFFTLGAPDNQPLDYIAPNLLNTIYLSATVGRPKKFTIEADALRFGPTPDTSYFAPCLYYQKFPALASNTTNWLLTNAPNVYLFGSLVFACIYRQDDAGAERYLRLLKGAISGLLRQDEDDRHSGSALTIQNDTGNP